LARFRGKHLFWIVLPLLLLMGEPSWAQEGTEPVAWVESHELATPGKRLLWHLEHFRCPTEQCQFAGAPLVVPGARAEVRPPAEGVRVCCGHAPGDGKGHGDC
jgi:hypothetical protein